MSPTPRPTIVFGDTRMEIIPAQGCRIIEVYKTPEGRVFVWWSKTLYQSLREQHPDEGVEKP